METSSVAGQFVSLRNAAFSYPKAASPAIRVARLDLEAGQTVALVGENGSGKTTFLKLLGNLLPWGSGEFEAEGKSAVNSEPWLSRCVYLHQQPYIFSGSVAYNIELACRAKRMSRGETKKIVAELLSELGLEGFASRGYKRLSGGEAQRVALARVLAGGAEVLLLDEPTASADGYSSDLIRDVLRERASRGSTVLFATHDKSFAETLAERVLEFSEGRIVGDMRKKTNKRGVEYAAENAASR